MAAEVRDVASRVPLSIFRYFGRSILRLPAVEAAAAFATTTWMVQDNAGYTIPAGRQVAIVKSGDELIPFTTLNSVVISPGDTSTAAGEVTIVAVTPGAGGNNLGNPGDGIKLLDTIEFVSSVILEETSSGGADAETDDEYTNRLVEELQLLTPRPILPRDFAVLARRVPGIARAYAIDLYNPYPNLLTEKQSTGAGAGAGWSVEANATISDDSSTGLYGGSSQTIHAIAGGDASIILPAAIVVEAGQQYTAIASFYAAATRRRCFVGIAWFDSSHTAIGSTVYSPVPVLDTVGAWSGPTSVTATAPSNAAEAKLILQIEAPVAGENHNFDGVSFRKGSNPQWSLGGTLLTPPTERTISLAVADSNGEAVSPTTKAQAHNNLESLRELNFEIYIIDPTYTEIDVTFAGKALLGADATSVQAAAIQAIKDYLEPANWGLPTANTSGQASGNWVNQVAVRRLELAALINAVPGFDYIQTLTLAAHGNALGTADVDLVGVAPLPRWNTISGSVSAP